jgi:hypothetical protein
MGRRLNWKSARGGSSYAHRGRESIGKIEYTRGIQPPREAITPDEVYRLFKVECRGCSRRVTKRATWEQIKSKKLRCTSCGKTGAARLF